MKTIIHVHQSEVKKRDPTNHPAIICRTYKSSKHYRNIEILGPSTIIHSDTPDNCGARVWITTESEVIGK